MAPLRNIARISGLFLLFSLTGAIDVDPANVPTICSDFNTDDQFVDNNDYQTNGRCRDKCRPLKYAYAITQYKSCWCSNYAPVNSVRTDLSKCDTGCPGFGELCGGDGLYGYVAVGASLKPSGVRGPSSSQSPQTKSTSTSPTQTSESSTPTKDPSSTQIQVFTTNDVVRTVTIFPTTTNTAVQDSAGSSSRQSGLSKGAIAGIAVGVIAIVLIAAGAAWIFFFRKRRNNRDSYQDDPSVRGSSSGMARPEMTASGGSGGTPGSVSNLNSGLGVDPRMDPFQQGLYARSGSHESVNTLRDDHDYSRRIQAPKVLRATNPDPDI